jgi:hypothetical protein
MQDRFNEFSRRYGIRRMTTMRPYYHRDYHNDYHQTYATFASDQRVHREEIIEIEIPRHALEHLIDNDRKFSQAHKDQRDEEYMRNKYSAISDAYDKYRMLLELYR